MTHEELRARDAAFHRRLDYVTFYGNSVRVVLSDPVESYDLPREAGEALKICVIAFTPGAVFESLTGGAK